MINVSECALKRVICKLMSSLECLYTNPLPLFLFSSRIFRFFFSLSIPLFACRCFISYFNNSCEIYIFAQFPFYF